MVIPLALSDNITKRMLHIATPAFRYQFLDRIYASIPSYSDITWHIAKVADRPALTNAFLSDPRVRVYELSCADSDTITKRNYMFDNIQEGYFHLLDDDTLFQPNMYQVYRRYEAQNFVGMLIGYQHNRDGYVFLRPNYPIDAMTTPTDSGMVLCHYSVLASVRWVSANDAPNDFYFWQRCYVFFGRKATILIPDVVSYYNYFGPQIRVTKKVLFWTLSVDIHSSYVAWPYTKVSQFLNIIRKYLGIKRKQDHRFPKSQPRF